MIIILMRCVERMAVWISLLQPCLLGYFLCRRILERFI